LIFDSDGLDINYFLLVSNTTQSRVAWRETPMKCIGKEIKSDAVPGGSFIEQGSIIRVDDVYADYKVRERHPDYTWVYVSKQAWKNLVRPAAVSKEAAK
jgi:hypothetical protein